MTTDLARTDDTTDIALPDLDEASSALQHILGTGDLAKLTNAGRVNHYLDLCQSLGLNPRSRPFDFIEFYDLETGGKKLTLYPNQSCASQLRRQHQISIRFVRREPIGRDSNEPMFVVEVEGTTPTGRKGAATKYVSLMGRKRDGSMYHLSGQQLANAYMKAETGALRRLTLSMVGLSTPADFEDLRQARVVTVDGTGRILEAPTAEQKALAADPKMAAAIGEPVFENQWPEGSDQFDGMPDQKVRPEELERPKREGPPPTLRASDDDVKRWLGAWFASVKGLSLDSDEARARYVTGWTAEWPEGKRTDSLRTMFARMTSGEAGDFLAHVRALMEGERRELLQQSYENMTDREEAPEAKRDKVANSVALTGGPGTVPDETAF